MKKILALIICILLAVQSSSCADWSSFFTSKSSTTLNSTLSSGDESTNVNRDNSDLSEDVSQKLIHLSDKFSNLKLSDILSMKEAVSLPAREDLDKLVNNNIDLDFLINEEVQFTDYIELYDLYVNACNKLYDNYYENLSKDDLLTDLDYLLEILNKAYAGLNLFLKDIELENIKKRAEKIIPESGMSIEEFIVFLCIELNFIKDQHLWIEYQVPATDAHNLISISNLQKHYENYDYFNNSEVIYASNLSLLMDGKGNYVDKANNKQILVDNLDFETLSILPFLSETGELYYSIFMNNKFSSYTLPQNIRYIDDSEKVISWESLFSMSDDIKYLNPNENKLDVGIQGKVYYVDMRFESFKEIRSEDFYDLGVEARKYPFLIIDLRGNSGGFVSNALAFINGLASDEFFYEGYFNYVNYEGDKSLSHIQNTSFFTYVLEKGLKEFRDFYPEEQVFNENSLIIPPNYKLEDINQALIVVLADYATHSAGEYALGEFRALSNSIFIGTNTAGNAISRMGNMFVLKNSDIPIFVPDFVAIYNNEYYSPETGYTPDIYTNFETLAIDDIVKYLNSLEENMDFTFLPNTKDPRTNTEVSEANENYKSVA